MYQSMHFNICHLQRNGARSRVDRSACHHKCCPRKLPASDQIGILEYVWPSKSSEKPYARTCRSRKTSHRSKALRTSPLAALEYSKISLSIFSMRFCYWQIQQTNLLVREKIGQWLLHVDVVPSTESTITSDLAGMASNDMEPMQNEEGKEYLSFS